MAELCIETLPTDGGWRKEIFLSRTELYCLSTAPAD